MNKWRLLLLAVIAVLQPVPSFTENNLVDGRRECCGHRPDNIGPHSLHGTFRKPSSNDRRLDARGDSRKEQRYEVRLDATSHDLALERTDRRASFEHARSIGGRITRVQERRYRHSFETRDRENRRLRESGSKTTRQNEADQSDSRHVTMSNREEVRGQDRLYRNSQETRGTQRARGVGELRQRAVHRDTLPVFTQERNNVDDTMRDRRNTDGLERNNEKSSRITRSLRRVNTDSMRVVRSRSYLLGERQGNIRTVFERNDERRQRDREFGDENHSNRRASSVRVLTDSTDNNLRTERVDRFRSNTANTNERLQRPELKQYNKNNRESRLSPATFTRKSRSLENDFRRTQRFNERLEESRNERSSRRAERSTDNRQTATQSLERVSLIRGHREERAIEQESNRRMKGENFMSSRKVVRSVDRIDRFRQRESPVARDRDTLQLPKSINIAERIQEYRNLVRMEARSDRNTRVRDMRNNERIDVVRNELREIHTRDSRSREDIRINKGLDVRRVVQEDNNRIGTRRLNRMVTETRRNMESASRNATQFTRMIRRRTIEDSRRNNQREHNQINKEPRSRTTDSRLSREIDEQKRDARGMIPRTGLRSDVTRNRDDGQMRERIWIRQMDNRWLRERISLQRESRDVRATRAAIEERNRDTSTRVRLTNERQTDNRDNRRTNERSVRDNRDFRITITRRESRNTDNKQIVANAPVLALDREIKSVSRDIRVRKNLDRTMDGRTNSRDQRSDARTTDLRLRNFESAKLKMVEETSAQEQMFNWQILFYTLQGAYMCGLIMKMVTEKATMGKTRKLTWWMSPKSLIKVD